MIRKVITGSSYSKTLRIASNREDDGTIENCNSSSRRHSRKIARDFEQNESHSIRIDTKPACETKNVCVFSNKFLVDVGETIHVSTIRSPSNDTR